MITGVVYLYKFIDVHVRHAPPPRSRLYAAGDDGRRLLPHPCDLTDQTHRSSRPHLLLSPHFPVSSLISLLSRLATPPLSEFPSIPRNQPHSMPHGTPQLQPPSLDERPSTPRPYPRQKPMSSLPHPMRRIKRISLRSSTLQQRSRDRARARDCRRSGQFEGRG